MRLFLVRLGVGVEPEARNSHTLAIAEKLRMDVYYIVAKFQVQQTQRSGAAGAAGRTAHSRQGRGRKKLKKIEELKTETAGRHDSGVARQTIARWKANTSSECKTE